MGKEGAQGGVDPTEQPREGTGLGVNVYIKEAEAKADFR